MSSLVNPESLSFSNLYSHLQRLQPPLLPPGKSTDPALTDKISSLYVNPCIEAALHILNYDLPSAHFLCRHMQAAPQYEGMYLHGILHRIEGDYDNARAWYNDVSDSEVFRAAWTDKGKAFKLIDHVQALKEGDSNTLGGPSKVDMERESLREIRAVIDFCVEKFGTGKVQDASASWKQPESGELKQTGQDMVSGGKGFRNF